MGRLPSQSWSCQFMQTTWATRQRSRIYDFDDFEKDIEKHDRAGHWSPQDGKFGCCDVRVWSRFPSHPFSLFPCFCFAQHVLLYIYLFKAALNISNWEKLPWPWFAAWCGGTFMLKMMQWHADGRCRLDGMLYELTAYTVLYFMWSFTVSQLIMHIYIYIYTHLYLYIYI